MKSLLKYCLILLIIFCSSYDAISITNPNLDHGSTEQIYIRITSDLIGVLPGGETVLDAGDNWFQLMEISGGYYKEISENGLLTGATDQYNTSVLLQQGNALTSLLSSLLVQNHSLEVEIIFITVDGTGQSQIGYEYVLGGAELQSMRHINSDEFEVKTIRLDFISQMVEQSDIINGVTSIITF